MNSILTMRILDETFGVCRLNAYEAIPYWALSGSFYAITKTDDELSIVCPQNQIPNSITCEKSWRALKIEGPLDFSLVGILSSIGTILAQHKISLFAISTFDTDYILVKEKDLLRAVDALQSENYLVK